MGTLRGLIVASDDADGDLARALSGRGAAALPVGGVPLVTHALRAMRRCGVVDVALAVSAATVQDVRAVVGDGRRHGVQARYFETHPEAGALEALAAARDALEGGPVLVHRGDGFAIAGVAALGDAVAAGGAGAVVLLGAGEDRQASVAAAARGLRVVDGRLPDSEADLAPAWALGPEAVEAGIALAGGEAASAAGLLDLAARMSRAGEHVSVLGARGAWRYGGEVDGLLEGNRLVLDAIERDVAGAELISARVEGRVAIHPSAIVERSTVRGPASIGPGAVLLDAFVGPYTSIGENVTVEGAEIEHSIVLGGASIRHLGRRLEASLVGREAAVEREFALPASLRLRVGRRAQILLA